MTSVVFAPIYRASALASWLGPSIDCSVAKRRIAICLVDIMKDFSLDMQVGYS